jgi:glycosyltransferase involved in cell wall biosynthesis
MASPAAVPSAIEDRHMTERDLRVLIISHGHPAFSMGGTEIASYNLFEGLNELPGYESYYLARASSPGARHRQSGLMSLRRGAREILFNTQAYDYFRLSNRNAKELTRDFVRFLTDLAPDLVHFHHFIGLGMESLYALRQALPSIRIVITFHEFLSICHHHGQMVKTGSDRLCYRASPAECAGCFPDLSPAQFYKRERFIKTFLELADLYVSPSRFLLDRFVAWGLPREKFRLIENGIDTTVIAPPRPLAEGGSGRRNRFAYFGQISAFKGLHVALDAVARVPAETWGADARFMVYGSNLEGQPQAFQTRFAELVERSGARARFYGAYRPSDLPRIMRNVDWVIVPSNWWENSPVVIQEAYLHGRPVICSDIGGMAEKVRDGETGLHFRVGCVEDLVDRLTEALIMPDLWERLRAGIPRPLSIAEAAQRHVEAYAELLPEARAQAAPPPIRAAG